MTPSYSRWRSSPRHPPARLALESWCTASWEPVAPQHTFRNSSCTACIRTCTQQGDADVGRQRGGAEAADCAQTRLPARRQQDTSCFPFVQWQPQHAPPRTALIRLAESVASHPVPAPPASTCSDTARDTVPELNSPSPRILYTRHNNLGSPLCVAADRTQPLPHYCPHSWAEVAR